MYTYVDEKGIVICQVNSTSPQFGTDFPVITIDPKGFYTYCSDKCLYSSPCRVTKKKNSDFSIEELQRIVNGKDPNFIPPQLLQEKIEELGKEILDYCSDNIEWVVSMIGEHDYKTYEKFRPILDMIKLRKTK